jgi:hypothetical protein
MENATSGYGFAIRGIARTVATQTVFVGGELVVDGVGIALRPARLLIYERLNPGHKGDAKDVPPAPDQPLGAPVQAAPPLAVSDQQKT